ncbi:type II toxin-antitoxin system VapC family toxin [Dyadobacter sp. CY323]|uniref:type II toxin-antitoxin system VapC family toxin n=1 Tax=Dyadobacter sp. CY323 TaxID=2907302 RepID=UPI001F3F4CCC|nr:type II toxin-antitoxin system VapC family toxin [Dyadobacter sp. CY323]MCE6987552.1 type II toxin-antitoxin system VapC family toxin [Dyadobacter sp. CY323]
MTYLLDTHIFLWAFFESNKLSESVSEILSNTDHTILVSPICFWEIGIKLGTGKIKLGCVDPDSLPTLCSDSGFDVRPLSGETTSTYYKLDASYHKDPFDRMLIWEALVNDYILITDDSNIKKYTSEGLKVIW